MKILVVGPGSIGSVYAAFAAKASVEFPAPEIFFFVKPSHRALLSNGITVFPQNEKKGSFSHFKNFRIIDSFPELAKEVAVKKFDAVLLTLPSDKLCAEGWLDSLLRATGKLEIWNLSPNLTDQNFIKDRAEKMFGKNSEDQMVWGRIPILCFRTPLPEDRSLKPGVAFYIPPGESAKWSSKNGPLAIRVARYFQERGFPSQAVSDINQVGHLQDCLLRALAAGMEKNHWSFSELLRSPDFPVVVKAMREMNAVLAKWTGCADRSHTPWGKLFSSGLGIRMFWFVMSRMAPFSFETFFKVHFMKLHGQMQQGMEEFINAGKKFRLPTEAMTRLHSKKPLESPSRVIDSDYTSDDPA